jgi:hypothetical protein
MTSLAPNSETPTASSRERDFEDEVRRIARLLWPAAEYGGASIVDGRERDGIFVTEDNVHIVECTVSRRKEKAEEDVKKIFHLVKKLRSLYAAKGIRGWFVTLQEPTADQRGVVSKHAEFIVAVSFDQFRSRLVDAKTYLDVRSKYPFGSVRDPEGKAVDQLDFVPLDLVQADSGKLWGLKESEEGLLQGLRVVLLGDYGAGKSTTLRELFHRLAGKYRRQEIDRFPILLNLRDHIGQNNTMEAIERHARNVGFPNPSHLVRAWRSGYALLLLDGFDEIATSGWVQQTAKLQGLRYRSMELVRAFLRESPARCGIALAGRSHFFDSTTELIRSLGLSTETVRLNLSEFTDAQIAAYLRKKGFAGHIPNWFPGRPLLLGYLASKNLLSEVVAQDPAISPALGWHSLLDRISAREAEIEAGIDGPAVRAIIERLATRARTRVDGLAPLAPDAILEVFAEVCGYPPDDRGLVLLQRLPGLGVHSAEDGSREFIDQDLVDAARAGDVVRFVESPFEKLCFDPRAWQCSLGTIAVEISASRLQPQKNSPSVDRKVSAAIKTAIDNGYYVLASDLVRVLAELGGSYEGSNTYISDVVIPHLALLEGQGNLGKIEFQDCLFQHIEVDALVDPSRLPTFVNCYFGLVEGRTGIPDLPGGIFGRDCTFEHFGESMETTSAILDSSLPLGTKVLLTVLKKLYFQRGAARRESALFRGLDHRARRLVPEVLGLLANEGLAVKLKSRDGYVWQPARANATRVQRILVAPNATSDSLLRMSAALS